MPLRPYLLALLAVACAPVSAQDSPAPKPEFQVTISAPQTIKSSAVLTVEATLTNNSDHSIAIWWEAGQGLPYRADVRSAEDNKIAPQTRLGLIVSGKIDLSDLTPQELSSRINRSGGQTVVKPGDLVREEYNVSQFYDLSTPGKYTVQLSMLDAIARINDESKAEKVRGQVWADFEEVIRGTVRSNLITTTVTP